MPGVWMSPFCAVFGGGVPGKGRVSSSDNRPQAGFDPPFAEVTEFTE